MLEIIALQKRLCEFQSCYLFLIYMSSFWKSSKPVKLMQVSVRDCTLLERNFVQAI